MVFVLPPSPVSLNATVARICGTVGRTQPWGFPNLARVGPRIDRAGGFWLTPRLMRSADDDGCEQPELPDTTARAGG